MMSDCNNDCSACNESCDKQSFLAAPHAQSRIKKVIGIVSGKGGVGKSLVTSLLAVLLNRRSHSTAILDADITGPSIPRGFGITGQVESGKDGMYPSKSKTGISIVSSNLLLTDESQPVIWRGPVIAGLVKQFWTDVIWGDVDFMLVDLPPGTGDVPLTVYQSLPIDGVVVVTTPQDLVAMIVEKAVNMAEMMNIPVIGIVENNSYVKCPDCGLEIPVYGDSHLNELAEKHDIDITARLPVDSKLTAACDTGMIELFDGQWLDDIALVLENMN